MAVRETSRESYKKLTDLGPKQLEVFNALKEIEPASDRDIEAVTGMKMGAINGRRGELMRFGYVVAHGKKYDKETHRNVMTWVTADPMAQRQLEKVVGKPKQKQEEKAVTKYSLRLKNGKQFVINQAMRDEVEASIKSQRGTIELAGHVFALSNIITPIEAVSGPTATPPAEKEETREEIFVEVDGKWQPATETSTLLRRNKTPFRTQRIGVKTGAVHYDMLMFWQDEVYETLRDMRGVAL
jgi:hypothetical protein